MSTAFDNYIDWKHWSGADFGRFTTLDARYYQAETGISSDRPCRVLELGFGNGSFLGWARTTGAEVWGIETNPRLVQRAGELFGPDKIFIDIDETRLNLSLGTFTHIVAFDVIEHISQDRIPQLLKRVRELLTANGHVILRFPNGDSPFGRVNQHGDPTHITTIGRGKIEYFANAAGLRLVAIRAPALPLLGVGLTRGARRATILCLRHLAESFASVVYLGGRRVPFDPNCIAVLHKAQS